MTPADISSLPSPSALVSSLPSPSALLSGEGGDNLETDSEDEVPLLRRILGRKSPASPAAQRSGQAACSPAQAPSKVLRRAGNPAAISAAYQKGIEAARRLLQSRSKTPGRPVACGIPKDTPQRKQLPLASAFLRKAEAAPGPNASTSEMRKSAGGGSLDAAIRHSRQAKHGERAEWSSSDSEQQGRQPALQDECAGIEIQHTSSPCHSARPQGNTCESGGTPVKVKEASAAGPKRRSSEVAGICAESLPGSKRLKPSGSTENKASAARLPCAKTPRRTEVTAGKATSYVHPNAPKSANPDGDAEAIHGDAPPRTFPFFRQGIGLPASLKQICGSLPCLARTDGAYWVPDAATAQMCDRGRALLCSFGPGADCGARRQAAPPAFWGGRRRRAPHPAGGGRCRAGCGG